MFSTDDEDGDFISPTGGAKLASLFGLDQASSQGNETFQYTAPKQPRKGSGNSGPPTQKPPPPAGAPTVLFATAVHAYRYVNGQYMKQGKLGAAVLGSHAGKEYNLLLYASQQKPVTSVKIHTGFIFTVQPSNYCTFYDDQRQNWSVMFESDKATHDFCKEVCLSKANSAPQLEGVVLQDLTLGEGQGVETGDSLEVAYTGWLLQNHTTGPVFDSNLNKDKLLRVKLGAGKVIKGWEEGMMSMKKGARRLLVVPPSQAYGSQGVANRVPPDSTLIFEVEIKRVKFAKDKDGGSERASLGSRDSAAPSPAPSVESIGPEIASHPSPAPPSGPPKHGEAPLCAKSNSINEQLVSPDASKAKLISRMAKMGQPMLPFLAGPAATTQPDSSDSEMEDPSMPRGKDRGSVAPSPLPVQITSAPPTSVHVISHPHANPATTAMMPMAMTAGTPQPMMPGSLHAFQPYSYTQSLAPSYFQPVSDIYTGQTVPYQGPRDVTSFLMTEARQHNTEIRLAVGKVADKVDQLASKVEEIQRQGGMSLGLSNVSMETAMIMHNIQRIIQENECLKKEVFEKSTRIEEQNRKIGELINQNQRYMEQSNLLMEQRNDSLKSSSEQNQARLLQAEQDKHALPPDIALEQARLTEELASATARLSDLQLEVSSQQQKAAALQAKLSCALQERDQHSIELTSQQTQLEEAKETGERAHTQYKAEKQRRKELELKLNSVEEELQDLRSEKDSLDRTLADRKRKWQLERERCDEEMEEVRRNSQQELDTLRGQLRKARTSTGAQEQLTQVQAELEQEWQAKCEMALATAREQQARVVAELTDQRDGLESRLTQLQDKFTALKQSRESEGQRLLQQQDQSEELQALQDKYGALEARALAMRQQYETRVAELQRRLEDEQQEQKPEQADTTVVVKRVMNGVFHSLRGEFDLNESYTGSTIIGILVNTIKNVTLQLLERNERTSTDQSQQEEDEEEDVEREEKENDNQSPAVQMNGNREVKEGEEDEKEIDERVVEQNGQHIENEREEEARETPVKEELVEQPVEEAASEVVALSASGEQPDNTKEEEVAVENKETSTHTDQEAHSEIVTNKVTNADVEATCQSGSQEVSETTEPCHTNLQVDNLVGEGLVPKPLEVSPQKQAEESTRNEATPLEETFVKDTSCGPPKQPPPPPPSSNDSQANSKPATTVSISEAIEEKNGEKPIIKAAPTTKPPASPTEEEDDELSLKGRPPPAPLFGEDDDEDDLDWLG